MKKKYETPYLITESFQLNAAVAGDCKDKHQAVINHYDSNCGYGSADGYLYQFFNTDNCALDLVGSNGGDGDDTLCYHGPYLFTATFTYS